MALIPSSGGGGEVVDDLTPQLGGDLDVNGKKVVSVSNGDIDIEPHGTGNVLLGNFSLNADQTVGAGQDNYVMTYDHGTGLINLEAAASSGLANVVEDTTPQLGGDLDLNGNQITSPDGTDLIDIPNGSIDLQTASTSRLDITDSGVRLGATGARVTSITDSDSLGTSDTILCTQGNVKAYSDAQIARISMPVPPSTRYVCAGGLAVQPGGSTRTVAANTLYYVQLFLWQPTNTWDLIGLEVTSLSAGNVRMGIYTNSATTHAPDALIKDAGTASTGTTGIKTITLNQSLDPGIYWLAAVFDATPTIRRLGVSAFASSHGIINLGQQESPEFSQSHTYGALPSNASSLTVLTGNLAMQLFIKES